MNEQKQWTVIKVLTGVLVVIVFIWGWQFARLYAMSTILGGVLALVLRGMAFSKLPEEPKEKRKRDELQPSNVQEGDFWCKTTPERDTNGEPYYKPGDLIVRDGKLICLGTDMRKYSDEKHPDFFEPWWVKEARKLGISSSEYHKMMRTGQVEIPPEFRRDYSPDTDAKP